MGGALDLHVLGAPLAFTLSQDQTLQKEDLLTWLFKEKQLVIYIDIHASSPGTGR